MRSSNVGGSLGKVSRSQAVCLALPLLTACLFAGCKGSGASSASGGSVGGGGIGASGGGVAAGTGGSHGSGGNVGPGTGGSHGSGGAGGITMVAKDRPVIGSFTATPTTLAAGGGPVTLSWSVTGADQLTIDSGVGAVTGSTVQANVTATTIFTLSASNSGGTSTKSAVVTVLPPSVNPVILQFSATISTLPAGGGQTMLVWQVSNAKSLSIDQGVGTVTGNSIAVTVSKTTIFTLTATNDDGTTTATTAVVIGSNPSSDGGRYAAMVSPTGGESFVAPSTLRLVAAGYDPNVYNNTPRNGLGGNASKVQFFVDDAVVLEVDGGNAEFWIFKGFVSGVAAGAHRVWARAIYTKPDEVLDSVPMLVTVAAPPTYDRTVDLDGDVVLSGSTGYELVGSADKRIRLNGNGHRITSSAGASGNLTFKFVDVFDLGSESNLGESATDVTTSGTVTLEDSIFDSSNTIAISQTGTGTASIRRNLFRSNMRQPIGAMPDAYQTDGASYPVIQFSGSSTGAKVFAGNNIGAGWMLMTRTQSWLVGGDTDADSNILIGPRVGIYADMSDNIQIRRNYSHHVYYGGWSQGSNFELGDATNMVTENNVVYGSSWPVRGVASEFRYNLVLSAGHQWLWASATGAYVHHNVFLGGDGDVGGIYILYNPSNVRIVNNTFDGLLGKIFLTAVKMQDGVASVSSNLFMNIPMAPVVTVDSGTLTTDYNSFFDPVAGNYSDGRKPAHDVAGGASTDPKLTDAPTQIFDLDEPSVWKRTVTVRDILTRYRMRYTPKDGSPLIDAGDPAGGAGNDVGAIGSGDPNASDLFGRF